jgi:drug/metabolite transporter (DMT)-like permease
MIKIGLQYSPPFTYLFIRFIVTLIIFSVIYYRKIIKFTFNEFKYGVYLGVFLFIAFLAQTTGLRYTTASNSAFITGTNIVLIPFAQILIIKSKPRLENIIGIFVVVLGLYFLTNIKRDEINTGDFLTIFCAIATAIYIVLLDKFSEKTDTNALIFGQFLTTTILTLFFVLFLEDSFFDSMKITWNAPLIGTLIFTALFNTFLGLFLSTKYQKYTTPVRAGLIYNMEQIFAVILAYFILSELLSTIQIIGAVIMILGVIISEFYTVILEKLKR